MMDVPLVIDYSAVARQMVKISDLRQKTYFAGHSLIHARNVSVDESRYYSVTALIATTIDPAKAGAVAKILIPARDKFEKEELARLPADAMDAPWKKFVEDFPRWEYGN